MHCPAVSGLFHPRYGGVRIATLSLMGSGTARGARLGLPAEGPGSIAPLGRRIRAFALDCLIAAVVAGLFTAPDLPRNWSLLSFSILYVGGTVLTGQTLGMRLAGLRLAQARESGRIGLVRAVARTALLMLVIPALFQDADGRGLHDRVTDTAVVRA